MARINVEDHKKAIFALNGIPPFEEEMTFYYDESGNCRKFSLTDAPLFIKNTNSQKNVQERMLKLQLLGVSNKESL